MGIIGLLCFTDSLFSVSILSEAAVVAKTVDDNPSTVDVTLSIFNSSYSISIIPNLHQPILFIFSCCFSILSLTIDDEMIFGVDNLEFKSSWTYFRSILGSLWLLVIETYETFSNDNSYLNNKHKCNFTLLLSPPLFIAIDTPVVRPLPCWLRHL